MFDDTEVVQKPPGLGWSRQNTLKLGVQHPPTAQRKRGWYRSVVTNPLLCREHTWTGALHPFWHHLPGEGWHRGVGNEKGVFQPPLAVSPLPAVSLPRGWTPLLWGCAAEFILAGQSAFGFVPVKWKPGSCGHCEPHLLDWLLVGIFLKSRTHSSSFSVCAQHAGVWVCVHACK